MGSKGWGKLRNAVKTKKKKKKVPVKDLVSGKKGANFRMGERDQVIM